MRPLSLLLTSLAAAAAATLAAPAGAQDREPRRDDRDEADRERRGRVVGPDGRGFRVFFDERDADSPALGVLLADDGRADTAGVRVSEVLPKSPAEAAGVRAGDRILAIGDVDLRVSAADADDPMLGSIGERRLRRELSRRKAGDEVTLRVARDGATRTVRVRTVRDAELQTAQREARRGRADSTITQWRRRASDEQARRPALGISVSATGSRRDTLGLFVARVVTDGPAEKAGIVEGDRIAYINGVDVRVPREDAEDAWAASARANRFTRELRKVAPGDRVTLRLWSGGRWRDVTATAGRASELQRERVGFFMGPDGVDFPGLAPVAPMPPMPPMPPMRHMAPTAPLRVPRVGRDVYILRENGDRPLVRVRSASRARVVSL
jgi:S1-C subfamily serine protease